MSTTKSKIFLLRYMHLKLIGSTSGTKWKMLSINGHPSTFDNLNEQTNTICIRVQNNGQHPGCGEYTHIAQHHSDHKKTANNKVLMCNFVKGSCFDTV